MLAKSGCSSLTIQRLGQLAGTHVDWSLIEGASPISTSGGAHDFAGLFRAARDAGPAIKSNLSKRKMPG